MILLFKRINFSIEKKQTKTQNKHINYKRELQNKRNTELHQQQKPKFCLSWLSLEFNNNNKTGDMSIEGTNKTCFISDMCNDINTRQRFVHIHF